MPLLTFQYSDGNHFYSYDYQLLGNQIRQSWRQSSIDIKVRPSTSQTKLVLENIVIHILYIINQLQEK